MFKAICHLRSPLHLRSLSQTLPHLPYPHPHPTLQPTPPQTINPQNHHTNINNPSPFSHYFSTFQPRPLERKHQDNDANEESNRDPKSPPKLFVVQPRLRPEPVLKAKLSEALNLANSLEEQRDGYYDTEFSDKALPPHLVVQNPAARTAHADTFFGPGTVDNVKCHMNALDSEDGIDAIFVNAILSGVQQRNLERAWNTPVLDRVGLIIEIFNAHAQTKEAKLQAELAALMYKKTRLVRVRGLDGRYAFGSMGESEVVSARGRGSGGRGFISGAGETELQLQRQRILERRSQLLSEIKDVRRTRALQRAARKRNGGSHGQGMPTIAIVGYTNAGKSTLVSQLSDTYLFCDDRLFATVDPKLRSVDLPSGKKVLLGDTVGFISDLPVPLVEAFHATLEEVVEADLLVHVLDSSAPDLAEQRESVLQVLEQIGVSHEKLQNMIEVYNKIDLQVEEFGGDEHGEENESGSFSGEEDNDDIEPDEDKNEEITGVFEEAEDDKSGDLSDGWLSSGDEHDSWVDYDGSSVGQEIPDDQQRDTTTDWRTFNRNPWKTSSTKDTESQIFSSAKDTESQIKSVPHVKTSAVTGVGLQELLELIDEKLKSEEVPERGIFDRKWRPPHSEDTGIAVEK